MAGMADAARYHRAGSDRFDMEMSHTLEQREADAAETRKESPVAVNDAVPADLPDPLQTLDDDTAASADALLRHLADEEVDRLLAEPKNPASPDEATRIPPSDLPSEPPSVDPAPESKSSNAPGDASANTAFSAAPIDRPSEISAAPSRADPPSPVVDDPLEADLQANTSSRGVEAPSADTLISSDLAEAVAEQEQREALGLDRVPWALRPLVWINRPFAGLNASTRELLGTIGLVTMVNALVVLLYVMLFRG